MTREQKRAAERVCAALAEMYQPHIAGLPDDRIIFGINDAKLTVGDLRDAVLVERGYKPTLKEPKEDAACGYPYVPCSCGSSKHRIDG